MYRGNDVVVKYRRSVILLGLAFVAAATHIFLSSPTVQVAKTGDETSPGKASWLPTNRAQKQQAHKALYRQAAPRFRLAEQDSLADYIHSTSFFQPDLHSVQEVPVVQCSCPAQPDSNSDTAALDRLTELHKPELPMPTRIQPLPPGEHQHPQIFDHFAEVYAINLPTRPDRRHYICSILQRLNISALLWPAFSKYTAAVRTYAVQRKTAFPNPIFDEEPPPSPQPPVPDAAPPPLYKLHPPRKPSFLRAQIACFVSHREVWLDIAAKDFRRPVLILEDDIDPDLDFVESVAAALRNAPPDWAILWVGHCFEEMQDHSGHKVGHRCALPPPQHTPPCGHTV